MECPGWDALPAGISHCQCDCKWLEATSDVTFTSGLFHMHAKSVQMKT